MRKPRGILESIASTMKRRTTKSATRDVYIALWGENPKQRGSYITAKQTDKK